jgi:BlaI family transcriptional regulator, penicillinase repressor
MNSKSIIKPEYKSKAEDAAAVTEVEVEAQIQLGSKSLFQPLPQISEAELEVMKILWELESATSPQIVEKLTVCTDWKPKTIHTLITRLVTKEAVEAKKIDGKSYRYTPKISEEEYKDHASNSFLKKLYKGSINLMLASFIKEQKLSKAEIDDLKKLLDEDGDES